MRPARVALVLLALSALPAPAQERTIDQAIDAVLGDHTVYRQLFQQLQAAVARHAAAEVAGLVSYPIAVNCGGHELNIRSPAAFVKNYDRIITPEIARVITSAE